jgi:putative nucleotidyltransferase with HDIG domain
MAIESKLEKIIDSIDELPPFPEIALRALDVARDPNSVANDVVDVIQYDQSITANCLRICNSTYFGLREKAKSLKHAVILIGTENLVRVILTNCSKISAYRIAHEGYGLNAGELWRHSVACALLSQLLIKKAGKKYDHELFTAALLHDIGKLIIDGFIADDFEAIYSLMQEEQFGFVEAEKAFFGIDHAELGGVIARAWKFPNSLVDAIRNHHLNLSNKTNSDLDSWTGLSNLISYVADGYFARSQQWEGISCRIHPDILNHFNLNQKHIEEIACELPFELKKAEDLLQVSA